MVDFVDYPTVLIKMFNHTIHDPSSHLGLFVLLPDSTAKVEFIQVRTRNPGGSRERERERGGERSIDRERDRV